MLSLVVHVLYQGSNNCRKGEHKVKNIFLYNMLKTLDLFGTKEPTQTPFGLCLNQQSERYRVKS